MTKNLNRLLLIVLLIAPFTTDAWTRLSSTEKKWLGSDAVDELYIPVLFGVSVDDIVPDFGQERGGGTRYHEGQDIFAPKRTPIVSPTKAVVTAVGSGPSAGNYVYTANPGGEKFRYMHLEDIANIEPGDRLEVGDVIGTVGDTGNAPDGVYHLHFEMRDNENDAFDPAPRLTKEFTLKQKISFLTDLFRNINNDASIAKVLVSEFESEFRTALAEKYDMPRVITTEIKETGLDAAQGALESLKKILYAIPAALTMELSDGSSGVPVQLLQVYLIYTTDNSARYALKQAGPTGYYGAVTVAAMKAYQSENDLPTTGVFDTRTRLEMTKHPVILNVQ